MADGETLWLFFHGYKPDDADRRPENRYVQRLPVEIVAGPGGPVLNPLPTAPDDGAPGSSGARPTRPRRIEARRSAGSIE